MLKELRLVVERKFSGRKKAIEDFISALEFEELNTSEDTDYHDIPSMRDHNDTPILSSAIENGVDVFITGDKDFLVLDI